MRLVSHNVELLVLKPLKNLTFSDNKFIMMMTMDSKETKLTEIQHLTQVVPHLNLIY
jgi:hypothetical protein